MQIQRSPDGLRRASLARMRCQAQAMIGGVCVDAAEEFRRSLDFVAADADSNDVAIPVTRSEFKNFLRFLDSEVARRIENPQQRYAEIAGAACPPALQSFEDGGEILLAIKANADRDVHLR